MGRYLLRRLILLIPTLLGISALVLVLMRLLPGDAVDVLVGPELVLGAEQRKALYRLFGLDAPIHIHYVNWLVEVVQGNLGLSVRTAQPITKLILQRLPVTIELTLLATALAWLVAIPLGVLSAVRRNGAVDFVAHISGLIGLSVPNFWLATMLLLVSSLYFGWQPSLIWVSPFKDLLGNLQQMLLPVLSLSAVLMAVVMRQMRSSMLEVLSQDYIRTARSKGLRERIVLARHAFKNAAIPVITVQGIQVGFLLGGAVVIEQIFGMPGIGWMVLNGIYQRDYPVVQGGVLFVAVAFVLVNLAVDLVYAYVDPRIRYD